MERNAIDNYYRIQNHHSLSLHKDMDVRFGTPSSNCRGVGICRVAQFNPQNPRLRPYKMALATAAPTEDSRLAFHFLKSSMTFETRQLIFSKQYFPILEKVTVPALLINGLGFASYEICPGNYKLQATDEHFSVLVEIRPARLAEVSWRPDMVARRHHLHAGGIF